MILLISALTFLMPLFFLPLISDNLFGAKNFLLAFLALIMLLLAGINLIRSKKLKYSFKTLDFFVLVFALVAVVSWFFLPVGLRISSFIEPLGLGTIISGSVVYFILAQAKSKKKQALVINAFLISATVVSLVSVLAFVLPSSAPSLIKNTVSWMSLSSMFIALQVIIPAAALIVRNIVKSTKKGQTPKVLTLVLGVIILVGLGTNLFQVLGKNKPVLLDWFSSWAITTESFKRKPFLGVGPGNFSTAFALYRPPEFNTTDNWNLRFSAGHSWFLQVWAELGLIGLGILVLIFTKALKLLKKSQAGLFLLIILITLAIFPGNIVTVFLFFVALGLARGEAEERSFSLIVGDQGKDGAPVLTGFLLIVLSLVGGYFTIRGFLAETYFFSSLKAAAENRGGDTYDLQLKAIGENRYSIKFRSSFAQTNLALALSLAQKGEDLTDEEKNQITQLMGQAVNEAKAAASLAPSNINSWNNLARIYRQLINAVEGADQWAVSSYQQAIALDSLDPQLRVDYGGLLYGLEALGEASRQFEMAVSLKPQYANAWYNWAWVLKKQNYLQDAVNKMQQAVAAVDPISSDYEKARGELDEWEEELGQAIEQQKQQQEASELTQPEPLPSPQLEEPIELPGDAAPPLDEVPQEEEIAPTEQPPTEAIEE